MDKAPPRGIIRKISSTWREENGHGIAAEADTAPACATLHKKLRPDLVLVGREMLHELDMYRVIRAAQEEDPYVMAYSARGGFDGSELNAAFKLGRAPLS